MRGIDYFTQEDERDWQRSYDRQVIGFQAGLQRDGRDLTANPITRAEYDRLYVTLCDNNDYGQWRRRHDQELEGQRVFWKGVDPLNLNALDEVTFDRPRLAPFKLKYDTLEEVRMRFNKTVILVKGNPFNVSDQRHIGQSYYLLLEDINNKKSYIPVEEIPDLRPAPPGYVKIGETNGYLKRSPARVNQQGMTSQSVNIQRVGSKDFIPFSTPSLVEALSFRGKILPWNIHYKRLIDDRVVSTFRLSDTIAVYKPQGKDVVVVEYKGRRLGALRDNTIHAFDEDDLIQPWVQRDTRRVDLEIAQ